MGCIITINVIEGKNPIEDADIKIGQNAINLYKIENQRVTENIITNFKTNKDGIFQAFILQDKDLIIEAEYNGKTETKKIKKSELSQGLLSIVFNFEESVDNEKNLIVKGQFIEYPINKLITRIQGKIILKFKANNGGYEARISTVSCKETFYGGESISLGDGKEIDWFGSFNQGTFWFGLDVPKGVDIKDLQIEAKYFNETYTSKKLSKEVAESGNLLISYTHPKHTYSFNAQLQRFNAIPESNNGVITDFYPIFLTFKHKYKRISGEDKTFYHNINIPVLQINQNPPYTYKSVAEEDSLELEYSFNNGVYTFKLKNIIGEITDAELNINYNNQGWKTHKGKQNGWPKNKFNFSETHTVIDLNLDNNSRDIIIPLNGWEGDFEISPNRRNGSIIDIPFEETNLRGMEITINDPNKRAFDKLDFKIHDITLKYNDSGVTNQMGFVLNMYICDSNFDPIMIKLLGAQPKTKFIHSIDLYSENPNININAIFPPFKIDPLKHILNISLNEIIMLPKKNDERIIVPQIEFIKRDNSFYDSGTYYVLVEVMPVHYIKTGDNAAVDSIGCPKRTVYKIIFE